MNKVASSKLLVIEPLEPLSLSRKQISGPRYFQATPASFPIPQPTTVLGVLGSLLNISISNVSSGRLDDIKIVLDGISKELECENTGPLMLGPSLFTQTPKSTKDVYVPIRPELYVKMSELDNVIKISSEKKINIDLEICKKRELACIEAQNVTLIGVSLKRRPGESQEKTVKPGFMYRYPVSFFIDTATKKAVRTSYVYVLNCDKGIDSTEIWRVGGENRVAIIKTLDDEAGLSKLVFNPLTGLCKGLYIATSYIPLIPRTQSLIAITPESESEVSGLEFLDSIRGILGLPKRGDGLKTEVVIERLGLGYSEAMRRKRPMIFAMPPGTLVNVEGEKRTDKQPLDVLKILWRTGYSTFVRVI